MYIRICMYEMCSYVNLHVYISYMYMREAKLSTLVWQRAARPPSPSGNLQQGPVDDQPKLRTSGVHKGGFSKGGFSNLCVSLVQLRYKTCLIAKPPLLNPPLRTPENSMSQREAERRGIARGHRRGEGDQVRRHQTLHTYVHIIYLSLSLSPYIYIYIHICI